MEISDTIAWLRKGASKAFTERFFDNFFLYFMLGILIGMILIRNPEFSVFECFMIASGGSLALLLVVIPFAYYFLGIRRAVRKSAKYQGLFLKDNVRKYEAYSNELSDIKKRILSDYLDSEGNTISPEGKRSLKECEDRLERLFIEKENSLALLEEERIGSPV